MIIKCIISFLNIWLGGAVFPVGDVPGIQFSIPRSHIALGGDLQVEIMSTSFPPLLLQLSRAENNSIRALTTFPVFPKAGILPNNFTVKIPCGYFSMGGLYYIIIKKQPIGWKNTTFDVPSENLITTRSLDVRWPTAKLTIEADNLQIYPEQAVTAIIEYPEVRCNPLDKVDIPEFFTELHFCGDSGNSMMNCKTNSNKNNTQVVFSEKIVGFPGRRILTINCQSFGLAGYYGLFLRPTNFYQLPYSAAYVKVNWSDQFVFNVHARSIFPCDVLSGGITVLFEYPSCILTAGDRIRLYASLRADVASLDPPTTLEYIAEHKVVKGQHSLYFECDLFTERYVEYCFVYVNKAVTGTMTDIRMDCVPTMPVTDQESGGWGNWSPWTPCTSTCFGGTRSRYRFCDSPPPRYGAKFCEGTAVETEKCGTSLRSKWDCLYGEGAGYIKDIVSDMPEVQTEVGSYCRCGCVVHLGQVKPTRLLATSSQSCPGRNFWLIQADAFSIIQFRVIQFHLSCRSQSLKIRDGNALSSNLLAHLSATSDAASLAVNSTEENLLLEFFSADDIADDGEICGGGFIAQATQIKTPSYNVSLVPVAQNIGVIPIVVLKLTAVHITAIFFLSGLLIATISLGIQYLFRYRKYHVAGNDDQDSLSNFSDVAVPLATRVSSNVTLLSEVISLSRFRPHLKLRGKHTRLRESMDCETLKADGKVTLAKEESLSIDSTTTLTQLETTTVPEEPTISTSLANSCQSLSTLKRSSTIDSDKDKSDEKNGRYKEYSKDAVSRRPSTISNVTLTNVSLISKIHSSSDPGCYSSAGTLVHKATIKSTSMKETKEKKNREKLMLVPTGSDFSISAQDIDLEMDYYDYNVVNAAAAPGSYLGMDPAFLVWIPPLDETGEIFPEYEKSEYHEMEEVREYVDPGSNKESPEEDTVLLPKIQKHQQSPVLKLKNRSQDIDNKFISEVEPLVHKKISETQLEDLSKKLKVSPKLLREDIEKETVEKGLSFENIKFADDEDSGNLSETSCNTDIAYQDKNVISSS